MKMLVAVLVALLLLAVPAFACPPQAQQQQFSYVQPQVQRVIVQKQVYVAPQQSYCSQQQQLGYAPQLTVERTVTKGFFGRVKSVKTKTVQR